MDKALIAAMALVPLWPVAAQGQTAGQPVPVTGPDAANFGVAVEQLPIGKGKGGLGNTNFAIAGFNFSASTTLKNVGGPFSVTILGSDKTRERVTVDYKVTRDGLPFDAGACSVTAKVSSGLWNSTKNGLYTCLRRPAGSGPADFLLEAELPNLAPRSGDTISMSKDDPEVYKVLKARMRYDGATYDAVPTALDPKMAERGYRAAQGWLIIRDGKTIARIDFPSRAKGFSDFAGSYDRKSVLMVPVEPADGRDAAILFAAQLLLLPEANSPLYEER